MSYFAKYIPNLGVMYAHNCYLQIWAEAGIFTLLSFLAFLVILLIKGIRAFRKNKSFILLGLICGILGFAVHSFFDTHLYSLQLSALFWLMSGFSQGLIDKAKQT
jgi:O-antigen ligase